MEGKSVRRSEKKHQTMRNFLLAHKERVSKIRKYQRERERSECDANCLFRMS